MTENANEGLRLRDAALLAGFCLVLFGYALVGGRPLTMHEAVLPQSTREMLADNDWIVPKCGGRPWLERPPLPQWTTAAVARLFGRCDREWIVRIPPVLVGTAVVLMTAGMAAGWYGRAIGVVSGLVLATMFEFTSYAWLAEQDIFLCGLITAAIALFVKLEFGAPGAAEPNRSILGTRSLLTLAFFLLLGATNLAKGLGFGTVMALAPIGGYLVLNGSWRRMRRYVWLWGWLAFIATATAWPCAAYLRHPDVVDLWRYDHVGRLSGAYTAINEPWWYYLSTLPWQAAPWTLAALFGALLALPKALRWPSGPERFLLLWAVLPVLIFSLPSGKHHHYLLHVMAPWGVLSALALRWLWERRALLLPRRLSPLAVGMLVTVPVALAIGWFGARLGGPPWLVPAAAASWVTASTIFVLGLIRHSATLSLGSVLAGITLVYFWAHSCVIPVRDQCLEDTAFLRQVARQRDPATPLFVNADLATMDAFRVLFYLDDGAVAVHNLTYLLDKRIEARRIHVITRVRDTARLDLLGNARMLLASARTRRESSPADRLALFTLEFRDDLVRLDPKPVSPMQAMDRAEGPYLRKLW